MKKITLLFLFFFIQTFAQVRDSGIVNLLPGFNAQLTLDSSTSTATLMMSGPADRWMALTFGSFNSPGAMNMGNDLVYFNGTTLVDAVQNGLGSLPTPDAQNDWTLLSNSISGSTRTIIATRSFDGGPGDYVFSFENTAIDLSGAHASSAILETLQYHGPNRSNLQNVSMNLLGVQDFSLRSTQIFPNPSTGTFFINSNTELNKVSIYSQTGALVRTIDVSAGNGAEVSVIGLQTGIYLIELQNASEKVWKKVVVE
jgi:hypothetical protein